jgi:hypothetical protein
MADDSKGINSSNKRYAWMEKMMCAFFNLRKDDEKELPMACLRDNLKKVQNFMFDTASPPKLFFFYQPRQFEKPELFLADGPLCFIKTIYFLAAC